MSEFPGGTIVGAVNNDGQLANILRDLDRCVHGRHQKDACFDCPNGRSAGNPWLQPGQVIGYSYTGEEIVVPDIGRGEHTGMVDAWRGSL
jgi:hypothetical protein